MLSYLLRGRSDGLNLLCLSYAMNELVIDKKKTKPHESNKIIYNSMQMTKEINIKQSMIMRYTVFMGKKTMFALINNEREIKTKPWCWDLFTMEPFLKLYLASNDSRNFEIIWIEFGFYPIIFLLSHEG